VTSVDKRPGSDGLAVIHHPSPITGFYTLFRKEWMRFWKVSVQTILAPVLTALLFLVVFAYSLRERVEIFEGVDYTAFLVPGLAMMSVLQNAFANSSSSLMQSKMTGNIIRSEEHTSELQSLRQLVCR